MNSEQIPESFYQDYAKILTKGGQLSFESFLQEAIYKAKESSPLPQIDFIKEWFLNINKAQFLRNFLHEDFHELILHDHQTVSIQNEQRKKLRPLSGISKQDYQLALETLAQKNNQGWHYRSPFVSFTILMEGKTYRCSLLHYSATPNNTSKLFLRSLTTQTYSLSSFHLDDSLQKQFASIVTHKKNLLIAGSTGSGKTSFLRALVKKIPTEEHIIILEDTYEILSQSPLYTNLLSDKEFSGKSLADYCAHALRMRPDRIILGEMRSHEVAPFLLAMNTGHRGLMSSIHANSGIDALKRVALLFSLYHPGQSLDYNLVLNLVCQNIEYVAFLENQKVQSLHKVLGSEGPVPYLEEVLG